MVGLQCSGVQIAEMVFASKDATSSLFFSKSSLDHFSKNILQNETPRMNVHICKRVSLIQLLVDMITEEHRLDETAVPTKFIQSFIPTLKFCNALLVVFQGVSKSHFPQHRRLLFLCVFAFSEVCKPHSHLYPSGALHTISIPRSQFLVSLFWSFPFSIHAIKIYLLINKEPLSLLISFWLP